MAHKSLSGSKSGSKSIKKTEFIAKIGSFDTDTDPDTDPDSIKMRIADAQEETKRWVGLSYANEAC